MNFEGQMVFYSCAEHKKKILKFNMISELRRDVITIAREDQNKDMGNIWEMGKDIW